MKPVPPRIIAHIFTSREISDDEATKLRTQIATIVEAQGRALVDLVIDRGPPKREPADHESLMRIARGEADGIMISQLPLSFTPKKTGDVLRDQLNGPIPVLLNAAELAERRLIPGGTIFAPLRPIKDAGKRAAELRAQGISLGEIARRLTFEGYRPLHGGKWHRNTVLQLLARVRAEARPEVQDTQPA